MFTDVELSFAEPRQFGFVATASVVRAFVPASSAGVYMLLRDAQPFYVGRSDHCVQTRLCTHELLPQASHFNWEPCGGAVKAFQLESACFHALASSSNLMNRIHPARPRGWERVCPFCGTGDELAFAHALRGSTSNSAAYMVTADPRAAVAKT